MDNKQLKKATITVLGGEGQQGKVISVLFNPNGYSFDRSNVYKTTPVPGLASPLIHFVNGEAAGSHWHCGGQRLGLRAGCAAARCRTRNC